jgi:hypothetical protein
VGHPPGYGPAFLLLPGTPFKTMDSNTEILTYDPAAFELDAEGYMEKTAEALGIKTEMGRKAFRAFCEASVLLDTKQRDYGSGNISAFGEKGIVVRMNDKIERLKTLVWGDKSPSHEKVSDTWLDIANYGVIGLLCHRGEWK